jgi:hypothetical protein
MKHSDDDLARARRYVRVLVAAAFDAAHRVRPITGCVHCGAIDPVRLAWRGRALPTHSLRAVSAFGR